MIQQKVFLRAVDHRYFDYEGEEYTSVSRVLNSVQEKFDAKKWSKISAGKGKYVGMTAAQVEAEWKGTAKESTDHGTRIHDALEYFTKYGDIKNEDVDLTPIVKSVATDHKEYKRVYSENECILYHEGYKVAGMCDKILVNGVRRIYADIEDYKTNLRKGIEFYSKYNKYMLAPVQHLQDCNFNRYALQLSIYGYMYECLTGNQIRNLWIRYIPAENLLNHRRIIIPYLRTDAENILHNFRNKPEVMIDTLEQPTF